MAAPTHLYRVFDNLLANAFRFTPAGGAVSIRLWSDDDNLIIEVEDTGEGIPREKLAAFLNGFTR